MTDQLPILRYVGDDWTVGPITLTAAGQPLNLSGAVVTGLFYGAYHLEPIATLTEQPSPSGAIKVAVDRTSGVLNEVWVSAAITAAVAPQGRGDTRYPTRLALVVTDSLGRGRTVLIVLYLPLDRRSDVPPAPVSPS